MFIKEKCTIQQRYLKESKNSDYTSCPQGELDEKDNEIYKIYCNNDNRISHNSAFIPYMDFTYSFEEKEKFYEWMCDTFIK